jgi:hypothetical protein
MDTVGLTEASSRHAFDLLEQVAADLTQEQADWMPPGIANPIGGTYRQVISSVDEVVHRWGMGKAPFSQSAGWQEKVVTTSAPEEEEDPAAQMRAIRVDLPALLDCARAVAQAVQSWVTSPTPGKLEGMVDTPGGELSVGHMLEVFLAWHITAQCGEIAALKGCQGARGYPF